MNEKIIKYLTKELDSESCGNFLKEAADDPELKEELIRMKNIKAACSLTTMPNDEKEAKEAYQSFIHHIKIRLYKKIGWATLKYAAIVVLCILPTFFVTKSMVNYHNGEMLNCINVPLGQRTEVTLQDGSTIWLNAGSKLTYPSQFSGNERKVHLEGEGYFEVKKNHHVPFIVETEKLIIKVLGTKFDVRCYSKSEIQQASLYEGKVKVYLPGQKEENSVTLMPRQRVLLKKNNLYIEQMDVQDQSSSWKDGFLAFDNTKLCDIVSALGSYYGVKVIIRNSNLRDVRYTGKFRTSDGVYSILRLMCYTHPFDIQYDDRNHIIYLK